MLAGTTTMPRAGYEPRAGPGGEVAGRPVAQVGRRRGRRSSHAARSSCQCASRNRRPVSSRRVSRAARETTRSTALAGVEQPAQHRRRVRRAGGAGDPDDPRRARRRTLSVRSQVAAQDHAGRRAANTNSAMPTKPLAVKKARLTRDRSSGRHDRVLVGERGGGQPPARPTTASPSPTSTARTRRTARTSPRARRSRRAGRTARRTGRARCARRSPGRPRRPGRRRSGRSRRSTARPPTPSTHAGPEPAKVPVTASQRADRRRPPGPAPGARAASW